MLCVPLVVLAGCEPKATSAPAKPAEAKGPPPTISAIPAGLRHWPLTVRLQGSLMGDENVVVGAKVAGRVKEVKVDTGSSVRQGDLLMTLENEDLDLRAKQAEAQLEQARAKLGLKPGEDDAKLDPARVPSVVQEEAIRNEARSNYERAQSLVSQKAISTEELQQRLATLEVAEARVLSALNGVDEQLAIVGVRQAELGVARQVRADADVRAPFDGLIQQRFVAPGAYLPVGQPVVSIVRIDPLRFRGGVPEREATRLRVGAKIRILPEGVPQPLEAELTRISPALEMASRALMIEADVPNPGARLRAGLFAEAEIVVDDTARTLALPASAISEFAGVEKVVAVSDGKAEERLIRTGRRREGWVEILQGIQVGDLIAADPRTRAGAVQVDLQPRDASPKTSKKPVLPAEAAANPPPSNPASPASSSAPPQKKP